MNTDTWKFFEGWHYCVDSEVYGDWSIDGRKCRLRLSDISHLLIETEIIDHEEIAWKGMHFTDWHRVLDKCICCNGERYKSCDITYPGVICKGAPNLYNKKYRMIDGKHRMAKMRSLNISKSPYYVIEYDAIKPLLQ